jgi:glycosyltransferase involved in cell wall biosynthesis
MKHPLKIIHTESHPQWGGQEIRIFEECRWMRRNGHHVTIIAPQHSALLKRASVEGWDIYPMSFSRSTIIGDIIRMRAKLRLHQPDILNTHGNIDSKVALSAAVGINIPGIIRYRHHDAPVRNAWHNRILYGRLCDCVITTADCITRRLIDGLSLDTNRVFTLPTGISPPSQLPDYKSARNTLSGELNLNDEAEFIGCVSLLDPVKGQHVLIDAFTIIRHHLPSFHLVFVGSGSYQERLRNQIQQLQIEDRVHFVGFKDNIWPYFRAFRCHVLPSIRNEGVPQVLLQAMFAKCPILATWAGGIPDLVKDGLTGTLVKPNDAASLAQAILKIIQAKDEALARVANAYRVVHRQHTLDIMGGKTLEIYENMLARDA